MDNDSSYIPQKKIDDEVVAQLHHYYEAANPKSVKGEKLANALKDLYNAAKEKFDILWKRPDGSRVFQLLFRRGDDELRNQLISDFEPILIEASKTRYSYYIVKYMISNGNASQKDRIFKILKGNYDKLLSHKIGHKVVETIYKYINSEQKSLLYLDFYGPAWKKRTTPISFEEICKQDKSIKNAAIKTLTEHLTHIINKDLGDLKLTQKLLLILGQVEPSALGQYAFDFKKFCFSPDGTQAAIISIQNAKPNDIKTALKLIENTPRKSVVPGAGVPVIAQPENQQEYDEEEEEEEAFEGFEQDEDEGSQENQNTKKKSNDNGEPELGEITASIACDQNAWRALCCAISYNNDIDVMKDEIIPNLFDQWNNIYENKNALQLLIRLISIQPSVFHDLSYQKDTLNEDLKNYVLPILADHVLQSINVLGTIDEGRKLIAVLMKLLISDEKFGRFAEAVFTKENAVDKIMNKLIRSCIQIVGKDAADLAYDTIINEAGIEEVLKTPGAWIIKELISTGNYKKLNSQAVSIIKKEKIEGPAIESILNPSAEKVEKPKKRFYKKNEKGGQKK